MLPSQMDLYPWIQQTYLSTHPYYIHCYCSEAFIQKSKSHNWEFDKAQFWTAIEQTTSGAAAGTILVVKGREVC